MCLTAEGPCRDEDWGFQLYQSDPSGNYGGWKATAIGANKQAAQNLLKQDYEEDITIEKAIKLVIKVFSPSDSLILLYVTYCGSGNRHTPTVEVTQCQYLVCNVVFHWRRGGCRWSEE